MGLKHYRALIFFCIFNFGLLFNSKIILAEEKWVEATGEAIADDLKTIDDVKKEALAKARRSAIEQAAGVKIQSETIIRDFTRQSDFVATMSSGAITDEKIIRWEAVTLKKDSLSPPILTYKVYLKAKVDINNGIPDPSFKIHASLNRSVFKDGDDVLIKIRSTKDCYITIFVITENNNVYIVFPNKYKKNNYIRGNEEFTYPSKDDVAKGLTLKAGLLQGCVKTKEMFRIIATKKPIQLIPDIFKEGLGLTSFEQDSASLYELVKELILIPANERTDTLISYEIVK